MTSESPSKEARPNRYSSGPLVIACVLWVLLVTAGFIVLAHEEFTPVKGSLPTMVFPRTSAIKLASDKPTLLLFAHPRCPCTRASLHELDGLLAETQNKVSVFVVFIVPDGVRSGWEQGDLWNMATKIPGVCVIRAQGSYEANLFKVKGSGHALLYAPSGELLFGGGITASRGHEGDNLGRSAVASLILTGQARVRSTPVFGCSLL